MQPRSIARRLRRPHLPLALAAASLLLALIGVSPAQATYGGLGKVDEVTITAGKEGNPGQVNHNKPHGLAFAADPKTGDIFIADELVVEENSKKVTYARIQEFSSGPGGTFLAESRIKLRLLEGFSFERVGGLAVDSEAGKVYLLIDMERPSDSSVEEEAEGKEETLEKKREALQKKEEKHEPTEPLKQEIKALEGEIAAIRSRLPLYDAEKQAAAEVWSFTIAANSKKELPKQALVGWSAKDEEEKKGLLPNSEGGKVPLLDPTGIAVDPKTHDVIIAGQQDEAPSTTQGREEPEEYWHAAIQRVHENGELGPRYLDTYNCLDKGEEPPANEEPLCNSEDGKSFPTSPAVSAGGRVFVEDSGLEIWETPATSEAGKGFQSSETVTDIGITPRHLFSLDSEFFGEIAHEEEGGALSFSVVLSTRAGWREGKFYLDSKITDNGGGSGLVEVGYAEPETEEKGKEREAREIGWTGGQAAGPQPSCVLASGNSTPVLVAGAGGNGEDIFAFTTSETNLAVWEYGPSGEGCGSKPTVASPTVEDGNRRNPLEPGAGEPVKLSSQMSGAQATTATWVIKYKNPESGKVEEETIAPGYNLESTPKLEHTFSGAGEYEVTETVGSDSLAYPTIVAGTVKLEVTGISVKLAPPESVHAQEEVAIKARLEDPAETPAHFKVVWNFGDGSQPVTVEYEGSPKEVEIKHAFAAPGVDDEVTVQVEDRSGLRKTSAKGLVQVKESVAEEQATAEKKKAEEQAEAQRAAEARQQAEALLHQQEAQAAAQKHQQEEAAAAAAAAAAKKHAEEEAAAKKKAEEEAKAKAKPPTRAQLLAKALTACKKGPKKKLKTCEATAQKKYGPKPKHKHKK